MNTITQTNRTILFEEINPEKRLKEIDSSDDENQKDLG